MSGTCLFSMELSKIEALRTSIEHAFMIQLKMWSMFVTMSTNLISEAIFIKTVNGFNIGAIFLL